jgi:hypothetical protein
MALNEDNLYVVYVNGGIGGDYFQEIRQYMAKVGMFKKERRVYIACTNNPIGKVSPVKTFPSFDAAQAVVDHLLSGEFPDIIHAEVLRYSDAF